MLARLALLLLLVPAASADGPAPLGPRTRGYDQRHLALQVLTLDLARRSLRAVARLTLAVTAPTLDRVRLHAVGLTVERVRADGRPLRFVSHPEQLEVRLPSPAPRGRELRLEIVYRARPWRGLYFVGRGGVGPPIQVWSQGQPQNTRHWIPCYDLPDDRLTSELTVTAPPGLDVVSNGALVGRVTVGGGVSWRWRQAVPHASYLISLVVGRFDRLEQRAGALPLVNRVPVGRLADARRAFARLPQMIAALSRRLGPYPSPAYRQTVVEDFHNYGMENTASTTLHSRVLDPDPLVARRTERLIAHELAHQWLGNRVGNRDGTHIWINEGFATYAEQLWQEAAHGSQAAALARAREHDAVLSERGRPLWRFERGRPQGLTEHARYHRGAAIVHLLRHTVGDAAFFAGLRALVDESRPLVSEDVRRIFEHAAGRDLSRLFDDFVYRSRVPRLSLEWQPGPPGSIRTTLRQLHPRTHDYQLRVPALLIGAGWRRRVVLTSTRQHESTALPVPGRVLDVVVDPDRDLPVRVFESRDLYSLQQLAREDAVLLRRRAARGLARLPGGGLAELTRLLTRDPVAAIRAEAARAMTRALPNAIAPLTAALADRDAAVRAAAAEALGRPTGAAAAPQLARVLAADPSWRVRQAAGVALAATRAPTACPPLIAALAARPPPELAAWLLHALGRLGDPRAVAAMVSQAGGDRPRIVRYAAIDALLRWRRGSRWQPADGPAVTAELRRRLTAALAAPIAAAVTDPDHRLREAVAASMMQSAFLDRIPAARPALVRQSRDEPDPVLRRRFALLAR